MSATDAPNAALIWKTLLANGATPVQAAGIMANMWFESNFNPESDAIDSNGKPSVGLINWNNNPTAAGLLTGNVANDIQSQISYLVKTGGLQAASGVTPYDAASNFAHNYEKCAACGYQGGNGQLQSRGALATSIYPVAMTGKWGTTVTTPNGSSSSVPTTTLGSSASNPDCVVPLSFKLPLVGGPSVCLWFKGWSRALLGGLLITAGGITMLAGLGMLIGSEALKGVNKLPVAGGPMGKAVSGIAAMGR